MGIGNNSSTTSAERMRCRAEQGMTLALSRQDFDNVLNSVNDLFFVLDRAGTILYVNQRVCTRLGHSETELLGRPFLSIYPAKSRAKAEHIMAATSASFHHVVFNTRNGTEITVETRVFPGVWNGDEVQFCVMRDLSTATLMDEKFLWVFNNSPVLMAISSVVDNRVLDVNNAFRDTLGYSHPEIIGRTITEIGIFVDPLMQARILKIVEGQGYARDLETSVRCKDGSIRYGLFSADCIIVEGKPCWLTTITDITIRKQAEKMLQDKRRRLAGIIEGTRVGTWEWNVQTGETLFNDRWAEITGYSLEEISPTSIATWIELSHPDDLQLSNELLNKHFRGEIDYYECETRMRHKNGSWVWVLDRGRVIDWTGDSKPLLMLGTHQDITIRKQGELSLIDNMQQLQKTRDEMIQFEKEAAVGRLVVGVAHELLNPVSIISSRLQFMEDEQLPEHAREGVRICREQLQRIVKISQELNQLSAAPPRALVSGDLLQIISLSITMCELRLHEDQIHVFYTPPPEKVSVKMEQDSLLKAMTHLILNACDALQDAARKQLFISVQVPVGSDKAPVVRVIIADSGPGIAEADMDKLFDPFFSTKGPKMGTGLGLTICKKIVTAHKGTIHAENNTMGGATFSMEFPLSDA